MGVSEPFPFLPLEFVDEGCMFMCGVPSVVVYFHFLFVQVGRETSRVVQTCSHPPGTRPRDFSSFPLPSFSQLLRPFSRSRGGRRRETRDDGDDRLSPSPGKQGSCGLCVRPRRR